MSVLIGQEVAVAAAAAGLLGLLLGWLLAGQRAAERAALLREEAGGLRAHAEEVDAHAADLATALAAVRNEAAAAQAHAAALERDAVHAETRQRWGEEAEKRLREAFAALASEALQSNSETVLRETRGHLELVVQKLRGDWAAQKEQFGGLIQPVERTLKALDEQVRCIEKAREGAYQALDQHLLTLRQSQQTLQAETAHLRTALTGSSQARGTWGEVQLRRLVELAGLLEHVDFEEQAQAGSGRQRPDLTVHLPNGGRLPVDAKTPLEDYLHACGADSEAERVRRLKAHGDAMQKHMQSLASKAYWKDLGDAPELVVMFVPNEACVAAAFSQRPDLIETGLHQRVLVASPVTLYGLLKAVAYGWQQQAVSDNARCIADEGRALCERIGVFVGHLGQAGRGLGQAVEAYNRAVASLDARLLPSMRRLRDFGATADAPEAPAPLDHSPRLPTPPETETSG